MARNKRKKNKNQAPPKGGTPTQQPVKFNAVPQNQKGSTGGFKVVNEPAHSAPVTWKPHTAQPAQAAQSQQAPPPAAPTFHRGTGVTVPQHLNVPDKTEHLKVPDKPAGQRGFKVASEAPKNEPSDEISVPMGYPKSKAPMQNVRMDNVVNDIFSKLEMMENNYSTFADTIEELREKVESIEANMHELTALYDALSAQYNPFIELTPEEKKMPTAEDETQGEIMEENLEENDESESIFNEDELNEDELLGELSEGESLEPAIEEEAKPQQVQQRYEGYLLPSIPDNSMSHMMAIKWTEFMLEKVGPKNIGKLLEYYQAMHWISEAVVRKIMHQVMGLDTEHFESEYDTWKMQTSDHMKSLVFIEKIKGGDIGTLHAEEAEDIAETIKRGDT